MGTRAHALTLGVAAPDPGVLLAELARIEARWSRFRSDSELTRLANARGAAARLSPDTVRLVELAVHAWRLTGGRFDPTVGEAVRAAGYDRTFEEIPTRSPVAVSEAVPSPGCDRVEVLAEVGLVRLPDGVGIDPGGIGKGLAADLVAHSAVDAGADGALVSIGGDLRAAGSCPPGGWAVEIDHGTGETLQVQLSEGAVATSSVLRRRWRTVDGHAHHVIDPRTGAPTHGSALAVTVVAGEAWWAEALATAVLVAWDEPDGRGTALDLLEGASALVTTAEGTRVPLGNVFSSDVSMQGVLV